MPGTNLSTQIPGTSTLWIAETEPTPTGTGGIALATRAYSNGTPPTTANTFSHGCLITQLDTATGARAVFQNTGSTATPVWSLFDVAGILPSDTFAYNSVATAGNATYTAAQMVDAIMDRDGGAVNRSDITATAALLVAQIPNATVGTVFYFYLRNISATAGETITVTAGAGVTLSGNVVVVSGESQLFIGRLTNVTAGAEAATIYGQTNLSGAISQSITAVTVNTLLVTTGAAGQNVTFAPVGTDVDIGFTFTPKAAGTLVLGGTAGTGQITLGSSSGAQTVVVGGGAGVSTVTVANGTGGNTVTVAGGATANGVTDTINIGTGAPVGTGAKTIHIGDGNTAAGTGVNTVTIGSNSALAHVTTIQGGNGATAINFTPQTTGQINIGSGTGTGAIQVGASSATQTVVIGNGAGISTVSIANATVAGAVVNVATAATGAGITDTISIATGNAAATGIKVVNILTGTPGTAGNNRLTMGGTVADSRVTIKANFVALRSPNYIATETGAANAIAGALTDAGGTNVPLVAGLRVAVKLANTLQAGANTFNLNAGGAVAIKKHTNAATDLSVAYAATGIIELMYDGAAWLDLSQ